MSHRSHISPRGAGGAGGKAGGGGRVAREETDSLRSRSIARGIDLLCEGEIEGLVDGLKSVYLDDTPVENADGSRNFKDFTFYLVPGTQDQQYIPGQVEQANTTLVNTEVDASTPWTQAISDTNLDAVRITLRIPALQKQDTSNGDVSGSSVQVKLQRKNSGGSFVDIITDTITGKASSPYERTYRIELPPGTGPWEVKVVRVTADSASASLQNKTFVATWTAINDVKQRFPNSAAAGWEMDAEQFSGRIARRAYRCRLLKVLIPSNYDPIARTYDGVWDGEFTGPAWTNNPAWVLYDLMTQNRYGLGQYIAAEMVDKWGFYAIAQYCDELVDDGRGGTEPRFTANLILNTRQPAIKVLTDFASICRGLIYYAAGLIVVTQDRPGTVAPHGIFGPANVSADGFAYAGTSRSARHTVALVQWNDLNDLGRLKTEYVEDSDAVARDGVRELNIAAFGCTSQGQANRLGKWALISEQSERETVTFRTGLAGLRLSPGDWIQTSDPNRAGVRAIGRVHSATTTVVTTDADPPSSLTGETLSCVMPDGSVVDRTIASVAGRAITVSSAYPSAPLAEGMWLVKKSNLQPETWRVISVSQGEGIGVEITAVEVNASKYDAVEEGLELEDPPTSLLPVPYLVAPPTDVDFEVVAVTTPTTYALYLDVFWSASGDSYLRGYRPRLRRDNGNWEELPFTIGTSARVPITAPGDYELAVAAVNTLGRESQPAEATYTVEPQALVFDVTALRVRGAALQTCTGTASTDTVSLTAHGLIEGDTVVPDSISGGAGLSAGSTYFVISSGLTADAFKLATTRGGSAVNFTTDISAMTFRKTTFGGREVALEWESAAPSGWLGPSTNDPFFDAYVVTIEKYNGSTWDVKRTEYTRDPRYLYTAEKMSADFPQTTPDFEESFEPDSLYGFYAGVGAGAWDKFRFGVRVRNRFGDLGTAVYISPTNIPPGPVTSASATVTGGVVTVIWAEPVDADLAAVEITGFNGVGTFRLATIPASAKRLVWAPASGTYSVTLISRDAYDQGGTSVIVSSITVP